MSNVKVNGINMYYRVEGSGKLLVMIMGFGSPHSEWRFQTGLFRKHYRIITFDNRGVGKSDKPPGPYSISMMADDAVGLMNHLGIEKAHVLGVSMGGMIAQETPTFNPSAGAYTGTQSVTISCGTSGATIRYTLDGSEPTSSSAPYSGPISVNTGSVTIKAKSSMSGMADSATASATYTISESGSIFSWPMFWPLVIVGIAAPSLASLLLWRRKK